MLRRVALEGEAGAVDHSNRSWKLYEWSRFGALRITWSALISRTSHGRRALAYCPAGVGAIPALSHSGLSPMKFVAVSSSLLLSSVVYASTSPAAVLIVSPDGTSDAACTRDAPCDLATGASAAHAGDTVILLDGVYRTTLDVVNSGNESAWITFQADECATPILEGIGIETDTSNPKVDQPTGVGSTTASYLRFIGLVSRGWNTGFGNGWTDRNPMSNGHLEFSHCVADGNGRTGFTFYSAEGIHIQNCISAHNGSSVKNSWSSGITLFQALGTNNVVEGTISFENIDAQNHSDGSGFIVDEESNDATLINNIAFGNGGSCLRLTTSSGTRFHNNTCYHNAQDPKAAYPHDPGEIYFTQTDGRPSTMQGISVKNNVFVATGMGGGAKPLNRQPATGWSNNILATGMVTHFTAPEGDNPDFTLAQSATTLLGKGATGADIPATDIGFDPKCITKQVPNMIGSYTASDWWQYSVDIDYIKSIGGVSKCFRPKNRGDAPDIGAYANGSVDPVTECVKVASGGAAATSDNDDSSASAGTDLTGSGCACRVASASAQRPGWPHVGLLALLVLGARRRSRAK